MPTGTSVAKCVTTALIAVLAALSLASSASAADRAFASRFSTNDTGDILAIGNTVMTCTPGTNSSQAPTTSCADARDAAAATATNNGIINNSFNMMYVDTDGDPSTFNSSTSNLNLPAGAQVLFAGLYWGGEVTAGTGGAAAPSAASRGTVKFKTPGGTYQTITASQVDDGAIIYQGFANVTSLVSAAGNGTYTLGNLQTGTGADRLGGWSLVIAYRDTAQPARNLTIFDGLQSVNGSTGVTIPLSGFLTPPSGPVKTELGFITYEGDAGLVGDAATLNNQTLTDATHPGNNFFNSHISRDGVDASGKNPDYDNQLGFDISYVKADGILGNNATSATIRTTTSGDVYAPGVITFATEIYAPKINQTKSVVDDNGGQVEQGDILTYTISGTNDGQDGTSGFVLRDPIPANTVYVPGSISVSPTTGGSASVATTDASADDRAEFDIPNNRVVARLGAGSTATAGGNVAAGKSYAVTFKVKVNGPATFAVPSNTTIPNTATASYFSQTTGTPLTSVSSATVTVKSPDLKITKSRSGAPLVEGGSSQYTFKVQNVGDAKTQGTVTVTDTLPNNLSATSIAAPGWTCTGATSITCTRNDSLAAGASYPDIVVNVSVGIGTPSTVSNTATVMGGGDGNLTNNSSNDVQTSSQAADISLTKVASKSVVNIGDEFDFTLVVTNNGPSQATSVAISDPIPGEFTYLSDDGACIYNPPTGVLGCAVGTLAPGASKTIKVRVRAESDGATKSISNTATAAAQQTDPTPGNNTATAVVAVTGVDLALTKVIDNATPNVGDTVTYTLKVRNNGPSKGTAVVLKDMLPAGLSNVMTNDTGHCTIAAGELSCDVGNLEVGSEYTVNVSGTIAPGTTSLTNNAGVAGAEADPDPTNNTAQVTTPVSTPAAADLSVVKTASAGQVSAGDQLTYTLAVHNAGPSDAPNTTVTDALPAGATFVSASAGCTESGGTVTCAFGTVPAGGDASATITVTVAASSGTLANTATVSGTVTDPNPGNNVSTVTTPVVTNTPDVSIVKTVDDATPISGDTIVYTLVATNNGSAPAGGVVVTDNLPAGVTFQSVTGPNCSQAAGTVTCNVGTLAPGASATIKITAKVAALAGNVPDHDHQFTVNKVENQIDLDPGQTRTLSIDCGPGFVLTDGSVRTDAVDQGTGDLGSVHVLAQHGTSVSGYTATVRNDATGRAQAKIFGVCLSSSTSTEAGHSHDVIVTGPITGATAGGTTTLDCGPGKTPIQPGWDFGAGDGRVLVSEPTVGGNGWTFTTTGPASLSIRCLDQNVTVVNGHTHTLGLERRTKTITVAPGQTAEVEVICGDNAKGIVGDWAIDPGLIPLGNDPRPKTRAFKFYNPTGAPLTARVGLLCLDDRTGPATGTARITNTGTVSTTSPDANPANNTSSVVVNVGGTALTRSGRARVAGSAVLVRGSKATVRVACLKGGPACVGTVQIKTMTNRKIATRKYSIRAAKTGTLIVTSKAFKTLKRAKFVVTGRDGRKTTQTVKIKKAAVKKAAVKKAVKKKA